MINANNFVYFVLERNSNPNYSFTGYTDKVSGDLKYIYKGRKDSNGDDLPHRFKFDRAHRTIRVHKDSKDIKGTNIANFISEFPECSESKNGHYINIGTPDEVQTSVWFKELKEHEDAITAIEAKAIKIKAENIALNLEGADLRELSILCGCPNPDEGIAKHAVLEAAGADPTKFIALYESPEREVKALVRQAVSANTITVIGTLHKWKEITLGVNEEFTISKLTADKDLFSAIKEALKHTGVS